jgi:hypothetical protein
MTLVGSCRGVRVLLVHWSAQMCPSTMAMRLENRPVNLPMYIAIAD